MALISTDLGSLPVRDGICVDPPLCRGTSQGIFRVENHRACVQKVRTVGKVGEVDEMGERELVLVVSFSVRPKDEK